MFAVIAAACSEGPAETVLSTCDRALELRAGHAAFTTIANEGAIASQVVPGGFGGLYQDLESGTLVVLLKDQAQSQQARDALLQVLGCGGAYPGWIGSMISLSHIEYRQGQYTGQELHGYLAALESLKSDADIWGIELDPELNAIWIGLANPEAVSRMQAAVTARGVPGAAVHIEPPPSSSNPDPFQVMSAAVPVQEADREGVFWFNLSIRYTNFYSGTRYPDQCVSPDPDTFHVNYKGRLERWNGNSWVLAYQQTCVAVLLQPRPVASGQSATDDVPVAASRRLNVMPWWNTVRVTGTYRFVGDVYRATTTQDILVTDLAPLSERTSAPFRLVRSAAY
jgi:hypothetical protein